MSQNNEPSYRLKGKTALITGGASGIGAATARRFVAEGARVGIADRDIERGEALTAELGDATIFVPTDVTIEEQVAASIATTIDEFGQIDCLFNNAGFGGALGPIGQTSLDDYDLTMDVLVKSVFLGMKHVADHMTARGSGSIINTASVAALDAGYSPHLYSAAKAAVVALSKTVAMEMGASGVRVNAICPGSVATPLLAGNPDATDDDIRRAATGFAKLTPIGRIGEPDDLASMALFLASDDSTFVTGQALVVDGGVTAGSPWHTWPEFMRTSRPIRHHRPSGR
jgi:NAD(P)-dependent dehydrogenase (short-subunit alcohol dehydrogenase family)